MELIFPRVINNTHPPSINDDESQGIIVGQPWVDTQQSKYYICVNPADGNASWQEFASPADLTAIIGNAPAILDTLEEFANAINNDPNFLNLINSTLALLRSDLTATQSNVNSLQNDMTGLINGTTQINPNSIAQDSTHRFVSDVQVSDWNDGTGGGGGAGNVTPVTGNYAALAFDFVSVNNTSPIQITLPNSPIIGDTIIVHDAQGSCETYPITVLRNGNTINNASEDFILNVNYGQVEFVFNGNTWLIDLGGAVINSIGTGEGSTDPSDIIQDSEHRFVTDTQVATWDSSTGGSTDPADIVQDAEHRFVTDTQVSVWNSNIGDGESIPWIVKTADYSSFNLDKIIADASSSPFNITMPLNPTSGMQIIVAPGSDFTANNISMLSGELFHGNPGPFILDLVQVVMFVYTTPTYGWIHTGINSELIEASLGGGTEYTHPITHPASMIVGDVNNRFVSDTQISTWDSGTGGGTELPWVLKTSTYTASNYDRIIADSSGGVFNITLPANPTQGMQVEIAPGSDWETNNVTVISPDKFYGELDVFNLDVNATIMFIYTTLAYGWIQTESNSNIIATSTGDSDYVIPIVKTTSYTLTSFDRIIADTVAGSFTLTLPTTPVLGDEIDILNGGGWSTNNLVLNPNGQNIMSQSALFECDVDGLGVKLTYYNSTMGWIIS